MSFKNMSHLKNIISILSPAILLLLLSAGCANVPLQKARNAYYSGDPARADEILEGCKGISDKDLLLCYMEKGLILFYQEQYEKSTEALLNASKFIKDQDQVSITEQSSALVVNDWAITYKGEYSEKLWVHTFLMMDYLMQHKYEDALVEAKLALEVYDKYSSSLADDHFTRALIALCYENMNMPDDARIEYEKLASAIGVEKIVPEQLSSGKGELVLFISQGRSPIKYPVDIVLPPSTRISIPRFSDEPPSPSVTVRLDGAASDPVKVYTDIGEVDRKSLNDRSAQYITRQAVRVGAKEAISEKVGEKNELAEALVRVFLFLVEEADTRSWETLPNGLTLVRIKLDAGVHDVEISSGGSGIVHVKVDVPEGKRLYRSLRF
jgi:uncharacterized protein